jgi:SAM-dependent methyltransferase
MEKMRKPFQGLLNIVRFNWHFYVFAFVLLGSLLFAINFLEKPLQPFLLIICILAAASTIVSLLVSWYVYDLSGLYHFKWLNPRITDSTIVNINAGFDETSALLKTKFNNAELIVLDFYDPIKHTEVSIKRARKAYPPFPGTLQVETSDLKLLSNSAAKIFVILSAHEIRDVNERVVFFEELKRVLQPTGQIYVIEHLRDVPNFLAYNIGFLHFHSKSSWLKTFQESGLYLIDELKLTSFISIFILDKNGNTH